MEHGPVKGPLFPTCWLSGVNLPTVNGKCPSTFHSHSEQVHRPVFQEWSIAVQVAYLWQRGCMDRCRDTKQCTMTESGGSVPESERLGVSVCLTPLVPFIDLLCDYHTLELHNTSTTYCQDYIQRSVIIAHFNCSIHLQPTVRIIYHALWLLEV